MKGEIMYKIVAFIVLKIAELSAVVFVPHYIGKVVRLAAHITLPSSTYKWLEFGDLHTWLIGLMAIAVIGSAVGLVVIFFTINWELADKLINKTKRRRVKK